MTAAWLLTLALSLSAADGSPVVAVAPFVAAEPELGRQVSGIITTRLAQSRYLQVVERSHLDQVLAEIGLQVNNPELFGDPAQAGRLGQVLGASWMIVGEVARDGPEYVIQARCVEAGSQRIVPGAAVWGRSTDAVGLADQLARVLHAKLTAGRDIPSAADDRLVRNDNSAVTLRVALNKPTEEGRLPLYVRGESVRFRITASEGGYLLVVGLSAAGANQLFPIGTMSGAIRAGQILDLPTPAYAAHGYDPAGFELYDDQPGVEQIHVFFARRPINRRVPPDGSVTPTAYRNGFLPRLRAYLADLDPQWTGANVGYYYGVDDTAYLTGLPADGERPDPAPDQEPPTETDRGPEIVVESVVGVATIRGDLAAARDIALLDARRNALEAGLGVMLRGETVVKDFQLVADAVDLRTQTGYVRVKKVLDERRRGDLYVVRISAVVTTTPLVSRLHADEALRRIYAELDRPRLLCLIEETVNGAPDRYGAAQTALVRHLVSRGLDVVEPTDRDSALRDFVERAIAGDPKAIRRLAAETGAEIVIRGTASAAVRGTLGSGAAAALRTITEVDLRVVDATNDRVLLAERRSLVVPQPSGDETIACRRALAAAIDAIVEPERGPGLSESLVATWLALPTRFTLTFVAPDRASLDRLVATMQPAPVNLDRIDLARPAAYRRGVDVFSSAVLVRYSPAEAVVDVSSPLRPNRALAHLTEAVKTAGWRIVAEDGARLRLVKVGAS